MAGWALWDESSWDEPESGSSQEDSSRNDWKFVNQDIKNQNIKQDWVWLHNFLNIIFSFLYRFHCLTDHQEFDMTLRRNDVNNITFP